METIHIVNTEIKDLQFIYSLFEKLFLIKREKVTRFGLATIKKF